MILNLQFQFLSICLLGEIRDLASGGWLKLQHSNNIVLLERGKTSVRNDSLTITDFFFSLKSLSIRPLSNCLILGFDN